MGMRNGFPEGDEEEERFEGLNPGEEEEEEERDEEEETKWDVATASKNRFASGGRGAAWNWREGGSEEETANGRGGRYVAAYSPPKNRRRDGLASGDDRSVSAAAASGVGQQKNASNSTVNKRQSSSSATAAGGGREGREGCSSAPHGIIDYQNQVNEKINRARKWQMAERAPNDEFHSEDSKEF